MLVAKKEGWFAVFALSNQARDLVMADKEVGRLVLTVKVYSVLMLFKFDF